MKFGGGKMEAIVSRYNTASQDDYHLHAAGNLPRDEVSLGETYIPRTREPGTCDNTKKDAGNGSMGRSTSRSRRPHPIQYFHQMITNGVIKWGTRIQQY